MTEGEMVAGVVLEASKDPHEPMFVGDPARTGVLDRWGWKCRCGSFAACTMTVADARADHRGHVLRTRAGSST